MVAGAEPVSAPGGSDPNLVETVKGAAAFERETLQAVVEARSRVAQTTVPPDVLTNPEAFKTFEQNQAALSSALSRLLVVVERYPDLKANQLPVVAVATRRHGEPDRRRAPRLHRGGAQVQHRVADLPGAAVGDDALCRIRADAELHRCGRPYATAAVKF